MSFLLRIKVSAWNQMNLRIRNPIIFCVSFMLLIGEWGCTHQTISLSPLPESIQQQLGRIGVVARPTEKLKALGAPGTGRLSNIGRGAGLYAAMGAGVGAQGGYAAVIGIPAGLALGLVGGAFYGAVTSESWQEPEATFRSIVADLDLNRALPNHLTAFAQSHRYDITPLTTLSGQSLPQKSRYANARRDGFETVLEIHDLMVNLIPAEYQVNPLRRLVLSARVQLIRTVDGTIHDDRVMTEDLGPALSLDAWMANHAARFRQEVQQAAERLAEKVVEEYFMIYRFPEQIIRGDFASKIHLKGLAPKQPAEVARTLKKWSNYDEDIRMKYSGSVPLGAPSNYIPVPFEFLMMAQRSNSYQPTFIWEPFPKPMVTYDFRIWRAGRLGPEAMVYERSGIKESVHKLETPLEPSTLYYWSVRANFHDQGKEQITEWSRRSAKWSLAHKILTLGLATLFPDPIEEGFYVFITPSPEHLAQENSTNSSQLEASCPWLHTMDPRWESLPVVQSLEPTLQWDSFTEPGQGVTYDLIIWRGETGLQNVRQGPIAYERQELAETTHRVGITLDAGTFYLWAVRARYRLNDQIKMTSWSHENATGSSVSRGYCKFWTGSSLSSAKTTSEGATQSQCFPWGNWPLSSPDAGRPEQSSK